MDHKTWLWRKRTAEKTIVVTDKVNLPYKESGEENEMDREVELERTIKSLNEKLSSTLTESKAKDELVKQHIEVSEEATAGWEKAEAEVLSFKQKLGDALQQRVALEGRVVHLDAALKECMRQLRHVQEEQEKKIHDAVMRASRDLDRERINLDEKIAESSQKLTELGARNNQMSNILQVKEKLIEDLTERKIQAEADFNALLGRLDSSEKDNASLKYEVCMLEKELEIRNKEREFNLIAADASQKQHQESMKKIAKLETECQRLRLLVRKRLPGPAALAQMKNEVESLGREKLDPEMARVSSRGYISNNTQDAPGKRISFLTERLCSIEEENKILKEALAKKNGELQSSRIMCARTASKLSQADSQLEELSKGMTGLELARTSISYDRSLSSISKDGGNVDEVSCAESWASALISELEHFRNGKPKAPSCGSVGVSELSLMDDFVEMERLAIVPLDKSLESHNPNSKEDKMCMDSPSKSDPRLSPTDVTGKELIPIGEGHPEPHCENLNIQSKYLPVEKYPSSLRDILRVVLRNHVSQKTIDEILEEVQIMTNVHYPAPDEAIDVRKSSSHSQTSDNSNIKSSITSAEEDLFDGENGLHMPLKWKNSQSLSSRLDQSIRKVVELIEGISQPSLTDYNNNQIVLENDRNARPYKDSTTLTSYTMRVFQWQSSELNSVLQCFVHTCNDLLQGKADLEIFALELSTTLDWVVNHCFSLRDVSSMKDTIKKYLNCDESCSGSELEAGAINSPKSEVGKFNPSDEHNPTNEASPLHLSSALDGQIFFSLREENEFKLKHENKRLKDEILETKLEMKDLEEMLQSETNGNESLKIQLQESEQRIGSLQIELTAAKESKVSIEEQIENHKLINEELDTQLTVARVELNKAHQKLSSLEVQLEEKNNFCEELEATCLELQLQLESGTSKYDVDEDEKRRKADWEISAATEKLAECQETILSLGKQLKAMASPVNAPLLDKVIPPTTTSTTKHRHSLLEQLLAEDEAKVEELKSPKTKEIICTSDLPKDTLPTTKHNTGLFYGWKVLKDHDAGKLVKSGFQASAVKSPGIYVGLNDTRKHDGKGAVGALAIVPKKQGGGFLRKMLLRKKESSKKTLSISASTHC